MIPAPNFTQVPNLLFDSIMSDLSDSELRVFLAIIRKTFGWSKTRDRISLTQLSEMTGMARSAVIYGLNGRVDKNGREVIKGLIPRGLVLSFDSPKGNEYMVHVEDQSESKLVLMEDQASPHGGPELVLMEDTQKKSSKETIQKKEYPQDSPPLVLATLLMTLHRKHDPKFLVGKECATLQRWADDVEKLIRIDQRIPGEIRKVIEWCQADEFWRSNILSASKLREKFPQLLMQSSRGIKRELTDEERRAKIAEILGEVG